MTLQAMVKFFALFWHMRMGYTCFSSLFKIPCLSFNFPQYHVCDIFHHAKQLELPFLLAIIKALVILS